MSRQQIPGSKPRKLITRTVLTNPSLISVSVTSLFNPENQSLPKIYNALEKKQQAIAENESRILDIHSPPKFAREASIEQRARTRTLKEQPSMDSLQQAEREFLSKKIGTTEQRGEMSPLLAKKQVPKEVSFMSRGSSTPAILYSSFNYRTPGEIKQKQAAGYNIISNLA